MMTQERSWTALTISEREVFMDRPLTLDFAKLIGAYPHCSRWSLDVAYDLKLELSFSSVHAGAIVSVYDSDGMVHLGEFHTCGQLLSLLDVLTSVNATDDD